MLDIKNVPIYLTTSNGRDHILKVFCHLFNKYWSSTQLVNIVGYECPNFDLPLNFKFISMGEQIGGPKMWATDLRKFFSNENIKYFVHFFDDQFLTAPTRFDIMQDLFDYMVNTKAARANLGNIRESNGLIRYGKFHVNRQALDYDICTLTQDAEYRISTQVSIWEMDYYLRYLIPGRSPWEYEVIGSAEAKYDGHAHLCTDREYPIYRIEGIIANNIYKFNWQGNETSPEAGYTPVSERDISEMASLGVISG